MRGAQSFRGYSICSHISQLRFRRVRTKCVDKAHYLQKTHYIVSGARVSFPFRPTFGCFMCLRSISSLYVRRASIFVRNARYSFFRTTCSFLSVSYAELETGKCWLDFRRGRAITNCRFSIFLPDNAVRATSNGLWLRVLTAYNPRSTAVVVDVESASRVVVVVAIESFQAPSNRTD